MTTEQDAPAGQFAGMVATGEAEIIRATEQHDDEPEQGTDEGGDDR